MGDTENEYHGEREFGKSHVGNSLVTNCFDVLRSRTALDLIEGSVFILVPKHVLKLVFGTLSGDLVNGALSQTDKDGRSF